MSPRAALAALAFCAGALLPSAASADEGQRLKEYAHAWFDGERSSGYLWGGAGLLSLGSAAGLYFGQRDRDVARGMAYPLAAFGLLQAGIGVGSLLRSSDRADKFDALVARSPEEARRSEVDRMRTVNMAFLAIEIVEVAVLTGSVAYAATRTRPEQEFSRGVALGLALEGGLMLLLDSLAASRAHRYAGQLGTVTFTPGATGQSLTLSGSF